MPPEPVFHAGQKESGYVSVLNGFEKSEETCLLLMELYKAMVNDPCNPSRDFLSSIGEKEDHFCVSAKRMVWAKFLELVFDEGRDPVAIFLIDLPGKSSKSHQIPTISNLFNMEFLV
jgi:hypothetical protein